MNKGFEFLLSLEGSWELKRVISSGGRGTGEASFLKMTEDPNKLIYQEKVNFIISEKLKIINSTKDYLFSFLPEQNIVVKSFYNNQTAELKFEFTKERPIIRLNYKCGFDLYNAKFEFIFLHYFILTYAVIGPSKDYIIKTFYKRKKGT